MLIENSFDAVLIGMVALFIIVILIMVYRGQKRNPDRSAGEFYVDEQRRMQAEEAAKAEQGAQAEQSESDAAQQ